MTRDAIEYNPMTGKRRDLEVSEEPIGVAEARWAAKRHAYLCDLLPTASPDARASYERELMALEEKAGR